MKILLAFTHMKIGGLSTYNYTLAKELLNRGYNVHVWTNLGGDFEPYMRQLCEVVSVPDNSYDLIILSNNDVVEFLNKSKIKGFRVYITHGIAYKNDIPYNGMANEYVGISWYVHKYISNNTDIKYAHYIPAGIDCSLFYPKTKINKKLTNVLSLVKSEDANNIVREACLIHNVNFMGWVQSDATDSIFNVSDVINEADVVVGWGRVVFETMACGRVPICYDVNNSIITRGDMEESLIENSNISKDVFGLVTTNNISRLVASNFSSNIGYTHNFTVDSILCGFHNYNYKMSDYYRKLVLNHFDITSMVNRILNLF
jgi:glycosyltransferase involved in cell wall biosynthesis